MEWIESRFNVRSERGVRLVLQRLTARKEQHPQATDSDKSPVILAHGTFSNHRTCKGIARYLAGLGYECWLIDYEGHGYSESKPPAINFEHLFLSGTATAIDFVQRYSNKRPHWVGHSGGGLAAMMTIARKPEYATRLSSLVTLGSQACHVGEQWSNRLLLRLCTAVTKLINIVPGKKLKLGPENEASEVMLQWYRWNLKGQWLGEDDFDYIQTLENIDQLNSVNILGLAGSGDWFIAPPKACHQLHQSLPANGNKWIECGSKFGFSENYSHARLISSRAASLEIWPCVADWLEKADTQAGS